MLIYFLLLLFLLSLLLIFEDQLVKECLQYKMKKVFEHLIMWNSNQFLWFDLNWSPTVVNGPQYPCFLLVMLQKWCSCFL